MNISKILANLTIANLNEIQEKTLESAKTNKEIILLAPTGSGKTLAFLLPLVQKLKLDKKGVQAIILVPTRELALQIEDVFKKMGTPFKINASYGGHATKIEMNNFSVPPAVLVGTPGRIAYHINRQSFDVNTVNSYVLDEFDKALEFGFQKEMEFIIGSLRNIQFKMLTSATNLGQIPEFTRIQKPEQLYFLRKDEIQPDLTFKKVVCESAEKLETVIKLVSKIGKDTVLIFCNHRDAVDRISDTLTSKGVSNTRFHGGLEQDDRELALLKFRNKSARVLITTDLAARGLDIPEIGHVIHYQIPDKEDAFIHRNGRTARMKAKGTVYVMLANDERSDFIDKKMPLEDLSGNYKLHNDTDFTTIYIGAGKKDKVNKIDIVGYLIKIGELQKEDIGLIEVKDLQAFAAVSSTKVKSLLSKLQNTKLKNKKIKITIARD